MTVSTLTSFIPNSSSAMRRSAGFTLIEILVVLFIVSIMTGVVIARMPSFSRTGDLTTEEQRLKQLLEMASQDALLQANEFGFKPARDGYQFYIYDDAEQRWHEMTESPYQARKLDDGIELEAKIEDNDLKLGGDDAHNPPPILILSSGETTPFDLTLSMPDKGVSRTLEADGFGDFNWQDDAQQK